MKMLATIRERFIGNCPVYAEYKKTRTSREVRVCVIHGDTASP